MTAASGKPPDTLAFSIAFVAKGVAEGEAHAIPTLPPRCGPAAPVAHDPVDQRDALALHPAWIAAGMTDLSDLDRYGAAILPALFSPQQCAEAIALWDSAPAAFRKDVNMARHGYGRGHYRYFTYPLPAPVAALRERLYAALAPVANRWAEALGQPDIYPAAHADFLARGHLGGQDKATPLLLRYETGDWNALHQDVYGPHIFPLQAAILLSRPGEDFTGGEFVLSEQRTRMQSRPEVVPLTQGDAVIFPVRERPVQGARGVHRVQMRHGVSRLRSGMRFTLGIIFHDAAS